MSSANPDARRTSRISRRQLGTVTAIGALAGSAWAMGLTAIARGREPHLTTLGSNNWQISLLELGTNRVIILAGEFESSIETPVHQLLTALRQHVDLVIGTGSGLAQLSMDGRLTYAMAIQLDAAPDQPDSPRFRALRDVMDVSIDGCHLHLERIHHGAWMSSGSTPADWMITLAIERIGVAFANTLDVLSMQAPIGMALGIAPAGKPVQAAAYLPGTSFAVNGYGLDRKTATSQKSDGDGWLIRTYPRDSARFRWHDGQLMLPDWAQPIFDQSHDP